MNGKDKIKNVRNVWVKGFIDKRRTTESYSAKVDKKIYIY